MRSIFFRAPDDFLVTLAIRHADSRGLADPAVARRFTPFIRASGGRERTPQKTKSRASRWRRPASLLGES
jgi:hypothetical protein